MHLQPVFADAPFFGDGTAEKLFEDELPTDKIGYQVDILIGDPKWATYYRGMYTHVPDTDLKYRLSRMNKIK